MRLRNSKPPSISKSAMNSASKTCLCEPSVSTYLTCLKSKTASLNCYGFGWSTPVSQSSLGWIRDMYQGPPRAFVALPNGRYFFALCTVAVHCTECQARTLTTMTLSWVHATNSFTPAEYTICPGDKSRFHCQMQSTHAEHQAITVRRLPIIPHHSKTGFPPPPKGARGDTEDSLEQQGGHCGGTQLWVRNHWKRPKWLTRFIRDKNKSWLAL